MNSRSKRGTATWLSFVLCAFFGGGLTVRAAILTATESSTGTEFPNTPWAGMISASDLINAGQSTLASATGTAAHTSFPATGVNNGDSTNAVPGGNAFFAQANFTQPGGTAVATYTLNLIQSPQGYDLTSIQSFMGWTGPSSQAQANQTYTVAVSVVGSADYTDLATVTYTPFPDVNGNHHESHVRLTADGAGLLATGVDAIRFTFLNPLSSVANGTGTTEGTLIREIDVHGHPTGGGPIITSRSSTGTVFASTPWAASLSATDLINSGQSTLASATLAPAPQFGPGGTNDGTAVRDSATGNTYFNTDQFPVVATYALNVAAQPAGYVITSIQSFMGWYANSAAHGNQTYTVAVRSVGSADYTDIATVSYSPFGTANSADHESHVRIESPSGILATGVDSIRFTLTSPAAGGTSPGTVIRELDVHGYAVGTVPESVVSIGAPTTRQVIQRGPDNTASVTVSGTYTLAPDAIEARLVVMAGAGNSGTTTGWTPLAAPPSGGTFSGTLPGVPAGGWYQVEVRSVTGGNPGPTSTVQRVGIGDIYITCGQSNSANYGSPAATVADDRVSAMNHANGAWTKAADPMPGAGGTNGSVWTRLGDLLAARDNLPVAFVCLGVGSTKASEWTYPGGKYYPLITAAVKAFPANGFRAILWHQGESDSISATTPAGYQDLVQAMIARSRTDAGWNAPWHLAEASFHPTPSLATEEPVAAGQRRVIYADPLVFPGPVTDDFHLEAKLSDTVHFNAVGLADHAAQWAEVLGGVPPLAPKNGDFEAGTALADGGIAVINTASAASPSVIGWRALAASSEAVADGSCGVYNPDNTFYAGAGDAEPSGGILPGMSGRQVAFLSGSSANAHFLQTRRAMLQGGRTYTLAVSLGVRSNGGTFGGATLELLADGAVLAARGIIRADLDGLQGGNAAGTFTVTNLVVTTGTTVTPGQPLAIRIRKTQGAGTYLDLDRVQLTSDATPFASWQVDHFGATDHPDAAPGDDPDEDGSDNDSEFRAGTDPNRRESALRIQSIEPVGSDLRIRWSTAGVRTNILQSAPTPFSSDFTDFSTPILVPGQGDALLQYSIPGGATKAPRFYYRVRLVEP